MSNSSQKNDLEVVDRIRDVPPDHTRCETMAPAASLTRVAIRRPKTPASETRNDRVHRLFDDAPVIDNAPVIDVAPSDATSTDAPTAARRFDAPTAGTVEHPAGLGAGVAPSAIIDLWEHLARHRLRPCLSDLDPVIIARQWPNSLMLRVTDVGRRP